MEIPTIRADIFTLDANSSPPAPLKEETKEEDAEKQQLNYHKADTSNASWLQKYMKNMNYNVIETDMNGDCFFSAIVEAFTPIGQITTVGQLRKKLSREVTEDLFNNYQNQFLTAVQTYKAETANLKTLETEYKKYQGLVTNTITSSQQSEYIRNAKIIAQQFEDAKTRKESGSGNLHRV